MKHQMLLTRTLSFVLTGILGLLGASPVWAAIDIIDYTAYPPFINKTVAPNVLFIIDLGDAQLPAAYGNYPISGKSGTITLTTGAGGEVKYASNVNVSDSGSDLVSSNDGGVTANSATVSAPSDVFDSSKMYYGYFDPYRCYQTDSNGFNYASRKVDSSGNPSFSVTCGSSYWDGNFLNWLVVRKKDASIQALMGGKANPAQSNTDGTADKLTGEDSVGENGSANTCNSTSKPCWFYVKWVTDTVSAGRVPSTLATDTAGQALTPKGRFFGVGKAQLFVNKGSTVDPFDGNGASAPDVYTLRVDLTTEPDTVPGTGTMTSCVVGDTNWAGTLTCYKRDRSLGLFQKLRLDAMHVGIMFADATGGKGGSIQYKFDDTFNSSSITTIRNQGVKPSAPLAEATYEALCLYRNSQGPCYNNSPADFAATVGTRNDPFWFCDKDSSGNCKSPLSGQTVSCCKNYILMISPGKPINDDNAPDAQAQFGNLFTGAQVGVTPSRLDDVAYYGQTHDIRDQAQGATGYLAGTQKVTFYAVNAMGDTNGAIILSWAAMYGGFEDRNGNGALDYFGVAGVNRQTCTFPAGSNLGVGTSYSTAEWDQDQNCIPDTYFNAAEGGDLEATVKKAIADILKHASSGTSISVLSTSSTGDGALYQAFFFPSTYEGLNEIKWTGYTQGLFIDTFGNIREDTDGDHRLVYNNDYIIQTRLDATTGDVLIDRFADTNGDGKADSTTPTDTIPLRETHSLWEAGKQLTVTASSSRNILTWVDQSNVGVVDAGEVIPFTTANSSTLAPYLRAGTAPFTSDNIINFVRGEQISGLRDRQLTVSGSLKVWKLGDPLHATPTIVGAPKERFDVIYGDASYTAFFQQYRNRRQVAYVGANDGMLHAFNGGFYHRGDDPNSSDVEHGYFTTNPTGDAPGDMNLGAEMWGFIPYQLLPQLRFLAQTDYTHVYYVDLKPKVTEARIFTADADHPGGWGIILIGGFRMGGSCGACTAASGTSKGAPPLTYSADFDNNAGTPDTSRTFYSAYFVLDITNPEVNPKLLWSFSDSSLGLTTSYPAVLRVSPTGDPSTLDTNAKFFAIFGSGATGYDGSSAQTAKLYAVDLKTGPKNTSTGADIFKTFSTGDANAFMGDVITVDVGLDYRADAIYAGNSIDITGPPDWIGKMYRLKTTGCTTAGSTCTTGTWGIASGGNRVPTVLLATFPAAGTSSVGPVTAASTVTVDDSNNTWVFFGTGRFYTLDDKTNTDTQYFFGVKDPVMNGGCTESTTTNCAQPDLVNVSSASVCSVCASGVTQVTGVSGVTTFSSGSGTTSLVGLVASKNGWYTTLPTSGERVITTPSLLGGVVFFPTFVPVNDICQAAGNGYIYALNYRTGSASTEPILGATSASGTTTMNRSVSLGNVGVVSQLALHIGAQGTPPNTGAGGGANTGGGCGTGVGLIGQTSGATTSNLCSGLTGVRSHYVSWNNQRD